MQHCFDHAEWSILEDCQNVVFSKEGLYTSPGDFMNEKRNSWEMPSVWHSRSNVVEKDKFNNLRYTKDGTTFNILFDGKAYLCNNEGKTIETILGRPITDL